RIRDFEALGAVSRSLGGACDGGIGDSGFHFGISNLGHHWGITIEPIGGNNLEQSETKLVGIPREHKTFLRFYWTI
ncbi:MAG: hypothetical protein ACP5M1_13280, partial [Acidiphilium sp.]